MGGNLLLRRHCRYRPPKPNRVYTMQAMMKLAIWVKKISQRR
jgi:hypothetical protein